MDLALENVSHHYDDVEVLSDIHFTIASGQIVCIIGPSGCGKTTLLRAIVDDNPVLPHGWIVQAVGRIFPTRRLRAFARIGLLRWEHDVRAATPLGTLHRHLTGVDFAYGAGLEYRLSDHISLRFALQRYQLRDGPVDFTSLGLRYDFHGAVR